MKLNSKMLAVMTVAIMASMGLGAQAQACGFKGAVGLAGPNVAKLNKANGEVNVMVYKKEGDASASKLFSSTTLDALSKMGYKVAVIENQSQAMEAAKSGKFQVIMASLEDAQAMQGTGAKVVAYSQTLNESQRGLASGYAAHVTTEGSNLLSLVAALKKSI